MKSLWEIEEAIARLPKESQQQLLRDMPALCPAVFPADGWDTILTDTTPRPALTAHLDELSRLYARKPDAFPVLNEDSIDETP